MSLEKNIKPRPFICVFFFVFVFFSFKTLHSKMSTVFLSEDGHGVREKSSFGPAPPHPLYVQGMAAFKSSGISLSDKSIIDKRDLLNNPPPLKGLPEIAPFITMEIPTSAENGTGKVTLTLLRPKGSENEILSVAVYL